MDVARQLVRPGSRVANRRDLRLNLRRRPRVGSTVDVRCIEPRPDVAAERVLRTPPRVERAEAILHATDLPVELRREVVDPSFAEPPSRVSVDLAERV